MASTRSGGQSSSPRTPTSANGKDAKNSTSKDKSPNGTVSTGQKRASDEPSTQLPKRGKGEPKKLEQQTIEESMDGIEKDADTKNKRNNDEDLQDARVEDKEADDEDVKDEQGKDEVENKESGGHNASEQSNGHQNGEKNAFDEVKSDPQDVKKAAHEEQDEKASKINSNNESIVEDSARGDSIPSSILEKGIVYFMLRPRVGKEDPKGINDVARSHIVLRPLPLGAKLGDGPLEDLGNARLIAVPKKMMPASGKDRFLSFVENEGSTIKELREMFQGAEYSTKTTGTSNQPAEKPFAEGIYALTTTGRESHLVYHITVPSSIGDLQSEMGLAQKGSFITSVKNPSTSGPSYATLDNPASYPESIMNKFGGRRWMSLEPEVLAYKNTQILLIGEGHGDLGRAVEEQDGDKKDEGKEKPEEEIEQLEEEDHDRVQHLQESDPVFADLGLSAKEFDKIESTW